MFETILYKKEKNAATITINRPDFGNAFSDAFYPEFVEAMDMANKDEEVRAIILTGKGRFFSAGGDIQSFKEKIESKEGLSKEIVLGTGNLYHSIKKSAKPVIAAVNGAAAGAGAGVALACDFIIMGKKTKIVPAFVNMAFPGDTLLILTLQRAIGPHATTRHLMLNEPITAELAERYNLSYQTVEDNEIVSAAEELAGKLAELSPEALRKQKVLMRQDFYPIAEEFNQLEADLMYESSLSDDHKEAVFAFLEKRKPNFK